jgi:hypothetical protein
MSSLCFLFSVKQGHSLHGRVMAALILLKMFHSAAARKRFVPSLEGLGLRWRVQRLR